MGKYNTCKTGLRACPTHSIFFSTDRSKAVPPLQFYFVGALVVSYMHDVCIAIIRSPASILYISIAGCYWPVSYPDGPATDLCKMLTGSLSLLWVSLEACTSLSWHFLGTFIYIFTGYFHELWCNIYGCSGISRNRFIWA